MKVAIAAVKGSMKGCRGATLVEFAMVLPVFVLLLFGIIEFGRYFFVQHTLQFATREGTRLALVGGTLADANGNPLSRTASIIKQIRDNASLAVNPAEISISIFPITANLFRSSGAGMCSRMRGCRGLTCGCAPGIPIYSLRRL